MRADPILPTPRVVLLYASESDERQRGRSSDGCCVRPLLTLLTTESALHERDRSTPDRADDARVVDAQPEPGVNMVGEDVVECRAREAQHYGCEVDPNACGTTGRWTSPTSDEAGRASPEPERAK